MEVHLGLAKRCTALKLSDYPYGKIGGAPLYLADAPQISCCNSEPLFILQIYCPVDKPQFYHRYIYIYQCLACFKSFAVRQQVAEDVPAEPISEYSCAPQEEKKSSELPTNDMLLSMLSSLEISKKKKEDLPDYTLEILEEDSLVTEVARQLYLINTSDQRQVDALFELMDGEDPVESEEHMSEEDRYSEEDDIDLDTLSKEFSKNQDKDVSFDVFKWAADRVSSQCVRYARGDVPIWYSDKARPALSPSVCECGARRVFEFQVLPQATSFVKDERVEFGSLYVFSCEESCESRNTVFEEAFYQPLI
jgi:pre-rRNA-processing protein TSR4